MRILIVSATSIEIKPLLKLLKHEKRIDAGLSSYSYKNLHIDVLITGVGMVQTAFQMGKAFCRFQYDAALNFGIAGCFDNQTPLGTVFHIVTERLPEMGEENGEYMLSMIDLKLIEEDAIPFKKGVMENDNPIKSRVIKKLPKVKGLTANTINESIEVIETIKTQYQPVTESMEGAAFFYACIHEGLPFAQIRAVCNHVGKRDTRYWDIPLAIENLNKTIFSILNE